MYQYLLLLDTDEEKEFFQELYNRYRDEMYYIAYQIVRNSLDAEDVVHETFLALTENLSGMMHSPSSKNWNYILTIVKHKCYNLYKKNKRELSNEFELEETVDVFSDELEERMVRMEEKELMLKLIRGMNPSYRDVLLLQYYHELEVSEIAKIMGKTEDNVRHISMRAKRKLQGILEENGNLR